MVNFVLQEFGEVAVVTGAKFVAFTLRILIADRDFAIAFDLHEDREEAEAGVPDDNLFVTAFDDLRIDERPGLLCGQLQEDNALPDAQLRGGDASAIARGGAPVSERIGKVFDESSDLGSGRILNPQGDLSQARIAELEDGLDRHDSPCCGGVEQVQKLQLLFRRQK